MAVFDVKCQNQINIEKKPRVYFTCHPDDFDKYFKKICEDIFKTHDCAIYYTINMNDVIAEEEKETDLGRINLFVVPVTYKLLCTRNRAMDDDIVYAFSHNIPVLPLMMESGLRSLYSNPDKFGTLQYLNPNSTDLTEIFYEQKLKNFLDSVLISSVHSKRIRDAFDAYIFLSYRKKNRKHANELMKFIHSNPECRDIAIWFDEFLIPGESFSKTIENNLKDSDLFTLLVTPDIFEKVKDKQTGELKDNYVISKEIPLALKQKEEKGSEILAVEMVKTDKDKLAALNITDSVEFEHEQFKARLLNAVSNIATTESNSPEHNFLIGLAYLEGIDVEVNRDRGIELITMAAESGLLEAMKKLRDMYIDGIGMNVDYKKAIKWSDAVYNYNKDNFGEHNINTLLAYGNLAYCYHLDGNSEQAIRIYKQVYKLSLKVDETEYENIPVLINNMASVLLESGQIKEALKYHKKAYDLLKKLKGETDPLSMKVLSNLGSSYDTNGFSKEGLALCKKAYDLQKDKLGIKHADTLLSLNNIGCAHMSLGNYGQALKQIENAYNESISARGKENPHSILFLSNMADVYSCMRNFDEAEKLHKEAYDLRCKVLGNKHPDSIISLNNLATVISDSGFPEYALDKHKQAYKLAEDVLGLKHPGTPFILNNFAKTHQLLGNYDDAYELQEKAYNLYREIFGENHPKVAMSAYNFAMAAVDKKKCKENYQQAYKLFKKAYEIQLEYFGKNNIFTMDTLNYMTKVSLDLDSGDKHLKYKKAAIDFKKVYEFRVKTLGIEKRDVLQALKDQAYCNFMIGDKNSYKLAYSLYKKVIQMEKEIYPSDDKTHKETEDTIKLIKSRIK